MALTKRKIQRCVPIKDPETGEECGLRFIVGLYDDALKESTRFTVTIQDDKYKNLSTDPKNRIAEMKAIIRAEAKAHHKEWIVEAKRKKRAAVEVMEGKELDKIFGIKNGEI